MIRKLALSLFGVVAVIAVGLVVLVPVWVFSKYPIGTWEPADIPVKDAWITARDGVRIHGWYLPHDHPRAVVLYAHGAARNITYRAHIMARLHDQLGVSVLAFDYRGYGKSEGEPSESGLLLDAHAAAAWLAEAEHVPENQLVLYGHSLGTAVMVQLAAANGARGLVLSNAFVSIADSLSERPWIPAWLFRGYTFDSGAKIKGYRGPLLMTHGDADKMAPQAMGRRLFALANEPKQFVSLPGEGHDDVSDAYYAALDRFIAGLPVGSTAVSAESD